MDAFEELQKTIDFYKSVDRNENLTDQEKNAIKKEYQEKQHTKYVEVMWEIYRREYPNYSDEQIKEVWRVEDDEFIKTYLLKRNLHGNIVPL
jgi:hypothetical protein